MFRRFLNDERVLRSAHAVAHAARVFAASVVLALVFIHVDEGARVVAPLALLALTVILAPALLERPHVRL